MTLASPPLFISRASLEALGDRLVIRDPAGRGLKPHLVPGHESGLPGVLARGSFLLHLRYSIGKVQGIEFCRATGDENPIHIVDDVVPGAYSAAKVLLPIEVLFPGLEIAQTTVRFTAIASYGAPVFTLFRCEPTSEGAAFHALTTQAGVRIAEVMAYARRVDRAPEVAASDDAASAGRVETVSSFIRSLHISPQAFFGRFARERFYPRSFLAALPSGAMVRALRGRGGLLNKLSLEFEGGCLPIAGPGDPQVALEEPKSRRSAFHKVLAAIGDGIRTYVRGSALVSSREALASALLAGGDVAPEPAR